MRKFKPSTWFDIELEKEMFGVKVLHNGKWIHAGNDDGIMLYDTEADRDVALINLREPK